MNTDCQIQHMRNTTVWTRVSVAFFLHMRCSTNNCLHADGVRCWSPPDYENYVMQTGADVDCRSILWPLLLLHCVLAFQHVLYAWSRPFTGTNATTSNFNSHITTGIGIGRYHSEQTAIGREIQYRCISNIYIYIYIY